MAFPTSGLTNNQVHKEGNRAFVYDSALGVWDQVRETDRTQDKITSGNISGVFSIPNPSDVSLPDSITLPYGIPIQYVSTRTGSVNTSAATTSFNGSAYGPAVYITPKEATSNILIIASFSSYTNGNYGHYTIAKRAADYNSGNWNHNAFGAGQGLATHGGGNGWQGMNIAVIDSVTENSVTQKTYRVSARVHSGGNSVYVGWGSAQDSFIAAIELRTSS